MILTCMRYSWCSNVPSHKQIQVTWLWCLFYLTAFDKTRQVRKQQLSEINLYFNTVTFSRMCFHFFAEGIACSQNRKKQRCNLVLQRIGYLSKIVLCHIHDVMIIFYHFAKSVMFHCSRLRNLLKKSVSFIVPQSIIHFVFLSDPGPEMFCLCRTRPTNQIGEDGRNNKQNQPCTRDSRRQFKNEAW